MDSNRNFQLFLLISFIAHGLILSQNPYFSFQKNKKEEKEIEINYVKKELGTKMVAKKTPPARKEPFLQLPAKITLENKTPPPYVDKETFFKKNKEGLTTNPVFNKPVLEKPDITVGKKTISLPPVDLEKSNNPSYISYYQIVREKIKRCAYQNYMRNETGEIHISFIISKEGYLKEARLLEERSTDKAYLKEIALRSIKEASPFPDFPKELDYPYLSFNVIISFETE